MTSFHLFQLIGFVAGGLIGWHTGLRAGGLLLGVLGAVAGVVLGGIAGQVPLRFCLAAFLRSLRRASTEALRNRLDREYYISHHLIAELVRRGEPVESFRSVVRAQLGSDFSDVRRFGEANARRWFPDLTTTSSTDDEAVPG